MGAVHSGTSALLASLAVCLAASLPFIQTLQSYFLSDDFGLVQLFSKKPTFHFLSLFTRPWTDGIYGIQPDELRPMLALSYQIDSLWGASWPTGYHLSSVALHALNSLLVLAIARRAGGLGLPAATFAGLLFAVLPIHAETVAWISGRADSIPALFYLSAFLAYATWRTKPVPSGWVYAVSVAAFFLALFSKQSAITMLGTLGMYDLLVMRRPVRFSWAWPRPYLPFAALTLGYLGLRYLLFGNVVREHEVTTGTLASFASRQAVFLKTLVLGSPLVEFEFITAELASAGLALTWLGIAVALLMVLAEVRQSRVLNPKRLSPGALSLGTGESGLNTRDPASWPVRGRLLFFGPVWWLICIAPLAVTYNSPRHLYLPSVGVAVGLGVLFHVLWLERRRIGRFAVVLCATALVLASMLALERWVASWRSSADISARISQDVQRELSAAPAGSLLIVGAPVVGANRSIHIWLWMWASPFALQPPFMPAGLAERVSLVEPPDVYCCSREQWLARTRLAVTTWSARQEHPPAIMLRWDAWSGALVRRSELDQPGLRSQVLSLADAASPRDMCERLDAILGTIGHSCETS